MNIGNIFNKVKGYVEEKQEENRLYNEQLKVSKVFENFKDIELSDKASNFGKIYYMMELCPSINKQMGITIDRLIPIYESLIFCLYANEKKTNQFYSIIFTNYKIWVVGDKKYTTVEYNTIFKFEIISKSLMSQIINFDDIVLSVDTTSANIDALYLFLHNKESMASEIKNKTAYLCGIVPKEQIINKIYSGITINEDTIVFHDKRINNYICNYSDIENYELYEDQTCVFKKQNDVYSHNITSSKQRCSTMSIKVTKKDSSSFSIIILEPTTFNSEYGYNDTIFIDNYNFGKSIIERLDKLKH